MHLVLNAVLNVVPNSINAVLNAVPNSINAVLNVVLNSTCSSKSKFYRCSSYSVVRIAAISTHMHLKLPSIHGLVCPDLG